MQVAKFRAKIAELQIDETKVSHRIKTAIKQYDQFVTTHGELVESRTSAEEQDHAEIDANIQTLVDAIEQQDELIIKKLDNWVNNKEANAEKGQKLKQGREEKAKRTAAQQAAAPAAAPIVAPEPQQQADDPAQTTAVSQSNEPPEQQTTIIPLSPDTPADAAQQADQPAKKSNWGRNICLGILVVATCGAAYGLLANRNSN